MRVLTGPIVRLAADLWSWAVLDREYGRMSNRLQRWTWYRRESVPFSCAGCFVLYQLVTYDSDGSSAKVKDARLGNEN